MSDRSFGNDIGNTTMTAAVSTADEINDVSLAKTEKAVSGNEQQMEKAQNGNATSRLPRPLAIEVYTKVHNCSLSKDSLLDEIEDLVDEKYFPGETLLSAGIDYLVVSSEKRGGLTTYTMEDGSKIGHRDLRRMKGLSVEDIKQIAIEDAEFTDGKWKVREDLLKEYPLKVKLASIFTPKLVKKPVSIVELSDDDEEEKEGKEEANGDEPAERNGGRNPRRSTRAAGTPAANVKKEEKLRMKEQKEKEKAEKKEAEKEEKRRKKEEEKAKKLEEKEKKKEEKAKKNGTMDKFVKKNGADSSPGSSRRDTSGNASIFSPSKWAEKRVAAGVKKMEDAWKRRDQEAYQEACAWCEKNLSGAQQKSIENPLWQFSVQKLVDKAKDKLQIKLLKNEKKAEFKAEMAEKRKATYQEFEPKIKAWFSESIAQDDLLLTGDRLEFIGAQRIDCDDELLKCMEITQFFVSMRKILLWNDDISAEQLRNDLHDGLAGFRRSTFLMIANLLETALQEKEYEKAAHCNARLSEFPITEHSITEMCRAFFIGKTDLSWKNDKNPKRNGVEVEEMDSEDKETKEEDEEKEEEQQNGKDEKDEKEVVDDEDEEEDDDEDDDEEERLRLRCLALFTDSTHIYEWKSEKQLEILYAMKHIVHELPIIKEWFLKDANSEKLTELRKQAGQICVKIEKYTAELSDLPQVESVEQTSRHQSREIEKLIRQRRGLEGTLDDLKDELEANREAAVRERDNLERIFRVVSIGTDRHLRKYYWFAYSCDAGIWVQDFNTTAYETWVRSCADKGLIDVESGDNLPDYTDLPFSAAEIETWYKLTSEESIRGLEESLKKNGRREKMLKKYLASNMDDILASIHKRKLAKGKRKGKEEEEEEEGEDTETETESRPTTPVNGGADESQHTENGDKTTEAEAMEVDREEPESNRFSGPLAALKLTMSELLWDWQQAGITKIGDGPMFETRMDDAQTLEDMKPLVVELVTSVPKGMIIEKFPQNLAISKKCFSQLKIDRFIRRVNESINPSCLHMLLAYFDARIDRKRTILELPCKVCHRKTGTHRKLICKQCLVVYHHNCLRPSITRETYESEGFKESWYCAKCKQEERRRQQEEEKAAAAARKAEESGGESSDEEQEEIFEEENPRSRNAKRKANVAMRDVLEFEGVLRKEPQQAPPPPKKVKKEPLPEVRELFDSIEKANPRLYKFLQNVPSQSRSTRQGNHDTRSLPEIEEDLGEYTSAEQLKEHFRTFFQSARGYIETHNSRKLDEFDSLISELNFL